MLRRSEVRRLTKDVGGATTSGFLRPVMGLVAGFLGVLSSPPLVHATSGFENERVPPLALGSCSNESSSSARVTPSVNPPGCSFFSAFLL